MGQSKETIRKFVGFLNNPDHLGGFWLPNIQRKFVWKEDQIEKLFDSVLREYPIGSLLIWKTSSGIKHRKFIENWTEDIDIRDFKEPVNKKPKMLILDGQQRLQSFLIGLKGSYDKKELYFNVLSGDAKEPDDIRYEFKFLDDTAVFPWVLFKDLVMTDKKVKELKRIVMELCPTELSEIEDDKIDDNLNIIRDVFCTKDNIIYHEVDSIDRPDSFSDGDIVEIFIRANSGGTKLDKSDLLFSLLVSSWDEADDNMYSLMDELNKDGFAFNRDMILKTCLVLFDKGASYNVEKFRDNTTKENIESNWSKICDSFNDVKDFIQGRTFIQCHAVLSSYLVLIPLLFFRYKFPDKWKSAKDLDKYLLRTLLSSSFSGNPDKLIDKVVKKIIENEDFETNEIFGIIRDDGRSLELSSEMLLSIGYTDKRIHLLFNLWYDFNYVPSYIQNEPQLDHIFPQSLLKTIKELNPDTGRRSLIKYKADIRDQLANMMLLSRKENGAGGKSDTPPEIWFSDKSPEYLDMHLIPQNPELWKLENYEKFIIERKKLILEKFEYLLLKNL